MVLKGSTFVLQQNNWNKYNILYLLNVILLFFFFSIIYIVFFGVNTGFGTGIGVQIKNEMEYNPFQYVNMPAFIVLFLIIGGGVFYIIFFIKPSNILSFYNLIYVYFSEKLFRMKEESISFKFFDILKIRTVKDKVSFLNKLNIETEPYLRLTPEELNSIGNTIGVYNYDNCKEIFNRWVEQKLIQLLSNTQIMEEPKNSFDYGFWFTLGGIVLGTLALGYLIYNASNTNFSVTNLSPIDLGELRMERVFYVLREGVQQTRLIPYGIGTSSVIQSLLNAVDLGIHGNFYELTQLTDDDLKHFCTLFEKALRLSIHMVYKNNNYTMPTDEDSYVHLLTKYFFRSFTLVVQTTIVNDQQHPRYVDDLLVPLLNNHV